MDSIETPLNTVSEDTLRSAVSHRDSDSCDSLSAPASNFGFHCHAHFENGILSLGNAFFEERWLVKESRLQRISFRMTDGLDWFKTAADTASVGETQYVLNVEASEADWVAILSPKESGQMPTWRFKIHPQLAGSILQIEGALSTAFGCPATQHEAEVSGIEEETAERTHDHNATLAPAILERPFLELNEVQFIEQSDAHAEFVFQRQWQLHPSKRLLSLNANLVYLEDPSNGEGLVFLLLAPSRLVRGAWSGVEDFRLERGRWGEGEAEFALSVFPGSYPLATLGYRGGKAGRIDVLSQLQRLGLKRPPVLLSNTWGDRSRASKLTSDFVEREIAAAAEIGVDVVQLDDGWQCGRTANTTDQGGVWNGFWQHSEDFWKPDMERFPDGLTGITTSTGKTGVALGLWFAPDSSNDFSNWERDATAILALWASHGVQHFKLDAVKIASQEGEARFHRLLDTVEAGSGGEIEFDIDATAELRTTYWGRLNGSRVFLQNRYTDWANYYPHQTLRALWSLAHYILPQRLRLEFLNPARNIENYGNSPLQPFRYPVDTLFAITMLASPLAWLELVSLKPETRVLLQEVIRTWKQHRNELASATTIPIGAAPNGWQWTGFVSLLPNKRAGYLLIFRELHPEADWSVELPSLPRDAFCCETLAGSGTVKLSNRCAQVEGVAPLHYLFARFTIKPAIRAI